jgi:predicted transposase/invertase (TIGR01784 family)
MVTVVPLRYDTVFKKAFGKPDIFCQFVYDVLGIEIHVDRVITGRRYPQPVSYVDIEYDLFAEDTEKRIIVEIQHIQEVDFWERFLYYHIIGLAEQVRSHADCFVPRNFDKTVYTVVVLTGSPRQQENNTKFSVATSNMDPVNEFGDRLSVYPHRLVFLNPRLRNEMTPESIRMWLELIDDSMDAEVEESRYSLPIQKVIEEIKRDNITPQELRIIKDEAAWERTLRESFEDGHEKGREEGVEKGRRQEKEQIALSLLQKGMDVAMISEVTGLKQEEVEKIKSA